MSNKAEYGRNSISSLREEDKVRKFPAIIFDTNDEYGAAHGVYEIIANAIDEAREGYGEQIRINIYKDGSVQVSDDGRGMPMDWNDEEGKFNWELIFCTMYASGKYDSSSYDRSLGTHGLGATSMQYASEYMDVESTRDGKTYKMHFEKGVPVGKLKVVEPVREGSGTTIRFKPDPDVFINIKNSILPPEYYINLLRRQAMLHEGLEIILNHADLGRELSLKYDKGISEFISAVNEKPILPHNLEFTGSAIGTDDVEKDPELYEVTMRLVLNFSRNTSLLEIYHNGSHLTGGGVTFEALKMALTKSFEDHAKDIGKMTKSDKFHFMDISSILVAVGDTNAHGNRTYFMHQTKDAINNPFIKLEYTKFIYNNIRNWLHNNPKEGEVVLAAILANKSIREEADKLSKKAVQILNKGISFGNMPKKFVDCKSKDKSIKEIYIVEGDSAAGSVKLARESAFQAIMPVRGKILNCLKSDLARILDNEIIRDLIRVLGCGIEAKSKYIEGLPEFNMNKFNWGKIVICTDADIDGMQIRCLVLTMIYRLWPTLLKEGKVFIAETPLFDIEYKKKTYFAYNQEEKEVTMKELFKLGATQGQIKVQRSKGLGENDPEMMSLSTMHPDTRRLVPVEYPENDEGVASLFNALLGDDIETREILINEYFTSTQVDIV